MLQPDAISADRKVVVTKALVNAGKGLGLSRADLGGVIGKGRTSIARGVDPESRSGELALFLIRCYRDLYVLVGDDPRDIRHWMHTQNLHTGGIPTVHVRISLWQST